MIGYKNFLLHIYRVRGIIHYSIKFLGNSQLLIMKALPIIFLQIRVVQQFIYLIQNV